MEILEKDWKMFKKKVPEWQEKYMDRLSKEYIEILSTNSKASDRFWTLNERIKKDKKSPGVFIDTKRSTAIFDIICMLNSEVIVYNDLQEFSDELKKEIKQLLHI